MVEVIAAVGGAMMTACFVSVDMHDDMKEVFHRLKEVELAVAEIKPRR